MNEYAKNMNNYVAIQFGIFSLIYDIPSFFAYEMKRRKKE